MEFAIGKETESILLGVRARMQQRWDLKDMAGEFAVCEERIVSRAVR